MHDAARQHILVQGQVVRIESYGAFVRINWVIGLVRIGAMGRSFVPDPLEIVRVGDIVRVAVLDVDASTGQVSLALAELLRRP